MLNKRIKYLIILIFVVALVATFSACSVQQSVEYNDVIESKYGDSFTIVDTYDAPSSAKEYKELPRVTKQIVIDGRISGIHVTGLYIPIGETIEITIEQSEVDKGHHIVFNQKVGALESGARFKLTQTTNSYERQTGGAMVEFENASSSSGTYVVTIKGAVEASYYRYGLDTIDTLTDVGNYITLDAGNVRLYVPTSYYSSIDDVSNCLLWWRNSMTFMDKLLGLSYYGDDYSPMRIYALNTDTFSYDVSMNYISLPYSQISSLVSYSNLISGNSGATLEIFKLIAKEKIDKSGRYQSTYLNDSIENIIASITYASMTDSYYAEDITQNYVLNSGKCLEKAVNKSYIDDNEKYVSMFMNVYYAFGEDCVQEILKEIHNKNYTKLNTITAISENTQYSLIDFAKAYDVSLSEDALSLMQGLPEFYLVGNYNAEGMSFSDTQTGVHCKIGETTTIDFASNIICSENEQWIIEDVEGNDGEWKQTAQGVYSYTPNESSLSDSFKLSLANGDKKVVLMGNVTVDIAICSYNLYEDVNFDSLKTAKKEYKEKTASESKSLTTAEVVKEDKSSNGYSFAVTTGALQVPETDTYTFYLVSSGLCQVTFGVKEYEVEMFSNSLTVADYTDELSYQIKLQEGYTYYFSMYVLSNKGSGFAKLGVKTSNTSIVDVSDSYLIYPTLKRSDIVEYISPNKYIESIQKQGVVYDKTSIGNLMDIENAEFTIGGGASQSIQASKVVSFVVPLSAKTDVTYIKIEVNNMLGVLLNIYSGTDYETVLATRSLINGVNTIEIESTLLDRVKMTFNSLTNYVINIKAIEIGQIIESMDIVASTNTGIEYIGEWFTNHSYVAINGSLAISNSSTSAVSYRFNGDRISIYATKGPTFGSATIYIDGKEIEAIDLYSQSVECSQMLFYSKLSEGDHTIEMKANGDTPINIDYFAVSVLGETKINNDLSKIWYVIFIPIIVIILAVVSIVLDVESKKKKKQGIIDKVADVSVSTNNQIDS